MTKRRASIKETGEELSPAEWERFDAAVAAAKAEREPPVPTGDAAQAPIDGTNGECPASDRRPG